MRLTKYNTAKSKAGFTLVQIMVVVGILGILALFFARSMSVNSAGISHLNNLSDMVAMKTTIQASVDCLASFGPTTCASAGDLVPLTNKSGKTIVRSTGKYSRFGKWAVRAECNADTDGLILRAVLMKKNVTIGNESSSSFLPHPVTKSVVTWASDDSLVFPENTNICPNMAAPDPATSWVDMECASIGPAGGGTGCYTTDGINQDEFCQAKGFSRSTGKCQASNGMGVVNGFKFAGKYGISCMTFYWWAPTKIECI